MARYHQMLLVMKYFLNYVVVQDKDKRLMDNMESKEMDIGS